MVRTRKGGPSFLFGMQRNSIMTSDPLAEKRWSRNFQDATVCYDNQSTLPRSQHTSRLEACRFFSVSYSHRTLFILLVTSDLTIEAENH